jgi:cell division protein FtsX
MGSYLNSLIGYATTTMPFLVGGTVTGVSGASASVSLTVDMYDPSQIGYATTSLTDPLLQFPVTGKAAAVSGAFGSVGSTTFQPSQIGYATRTLNVPGT